MTYESEVKASWGVALAELRDKLASVNSWSILYDSTSGSDIITKGDEFVIQTGQGEEFLLRLEEREAGLVIQHGKDFNDTTLEWNDRFDADPDSCNDFYDLQSRVQFADVTDPAQSYKQRYSFAEGVTVYPKNSGYREFVIDDGAGGDTRRYTYLGPDGLTPNDRGKYWINYKESGFIFYWQRSEQDGQDEEMFFGMTEVNKAWEYQNANADESRYVMAFGDSRFDEKEYTGSSNPTQEDHGKQRLIHMSGSGKLGSRPLYKSNNDPTAALNVNDDDNGIVQDEDGNNVYQRDATYNRPSNEYVARGNANPDNEIDNYPYTNSIIASSAFTAFNGEEALIGTHDFWIDDISSSETGHKDIVEDQNGDDLYILLKRKSLPKIGMKVI